MRLQLATLILVLQPVVASAGVLIEVSAKDPAAKEPTITTMQAGADRFRVDGDGQIVIYRADKDVAWLIDPQAKTYSELNRKVMHEATSATDQINAALATMSPEERAMVQGLMAAHAPAATASAPPSLRYAGTERREVVNGFPCEVKDTLQGDKRVGEVCVTSWTAAKVNESDVAVMKKFAEFMKGLTGQFAQAASAREVPDIAALNGLPVRTISTTPKGDVVQEIVKLEQADVPASAFELPAGLKREDLGAR